jgi:predicted DsbA family dithiol-disulfide isomerase
MALENPHVSAAIIEANEYPDLIDRYGIDAVPKIVINDRIELLGAQPESVFVAQVADSVQPKPEQEPTAQEP